jgi:alkanesulfonate monooxygenase SsuD/methylene tetrahydromethanopterin reductase-like flavin-dependent oxidoreductase (luciferase family)
MALARERRVQARRPLLPLLTTRALKLTSPQGRHPDHLAAIGPKNTALAGEIADGWIPTLFSPEHVSELRPLLEEGAARSGKSLEGFDIAPTVNVFVTDDLQGARDAMRPFIALYLGGKGSRKQTFYNNLVQRYGFEAAPKTIQDLYLKASARRRWPHPRQPDRQGLAVRALGYGFASAWRSPRRGVGTRGITPDRVHLRGAPGAATGWSPRLAAA